MSKDNGHKKIEKLSFRNLGTEIDLQIVIENGEQFAQARKDLVEIKKLYDDIEKRFSRFDKKSELSYLNEHLGEFVATSSKMIEIAKKSILYNETTGGFFDPRIIGNLEAIGYDRTFDLVEPSGEYLDENVFSFERKLSEDLLIGSGELCFKKRMDFSGIVKGYATDKMAEVLRAKGWKNFLVDSGGDMFFAGNGEDGKKWRVDIEGIPEKSLMLELSGQGVATSGIGRRKWERGGKRYHHIVNPKNPDEFSFELQSVTVVDETTEKADVWAKTLLLSGFSEAKKIAEDKSIACVILEYSGRAWISSQVKKYIFT